MAIPFRYNFEAYLINSLRFSEPLIFHISLPRLRYFSDKKRIAPKILDSKMWREESENFSLSKIFGKIILKLLQFRRLKFSQDDRKDTKAIAPLRMHLWESLSLTLESLKSVFNVFRRKPSLGAPDRFPQQISCLT